ncbi:MAG: hypothetical protein K6U79_04315 [Firmicutes bacterium]|nr:hypothetical protein [Bacillota bacterium]
MTASPLLLEHLSEGDLRFLARVTGREGEGEAGAVERLRREPEEVEAALDDPRLFAELSRGEEWLARVTPFLLFQVFLRRALRDLASTSYASELAGPRLRVPLFDTPELVRFLADRQRRDYLALLLASFTRAGSGRVWVRTARGPRRMRVSELDLRRMRELAQVVDARDRFLVYRRVGDLALFLSGVFAEHVAALSPAPLDWLEEEGRRYYGLAADQAGAGLSGWRQVLESLASDFRRARRILNYASWHYFRGWQERLFGTPV